MAKLEGIWFDEMNKEQFGGTLEDPDGLQDKYRVFNAPKYTDGHPAEVFAGFSATSPHGLEINGALHEVEGFVFVLKPNHDHHAKVALAAYAASCAVDKPQLSKDLRDMLEQDEWGVD